MSKKIWRECRDSSGCRLTCPPSVPNCTVIQDSAHFPVKEAMALCKAVTARHSVTSAEELQVEASSMLDAYLKYLRAVERMKKKAKP
jgi:hypothetical protein